MQLKSITIAFALSACCGAATADVPFGTFSSGEMSEVMSCFYECKPGPTVGGIPTWREVTSLMLVNQSPTQPALALIGILDGNERILAGAQVDLSPLDLDEINICRTLFAAGLPVPQAGLVEIAVPVNPPTVYGWIKNLLGKFNVNVNEPFAGRVDGVGKTQCRGVPPEVARAQQVLGIFDQSGAPVILPVLIEDTADLTGGAP